MPNSSTRFNLNKILFTGLVTCISTRDVRHTDQVLEHSVKRKNQKQWPCKLIPSDERERQADIQLYMSTKPCFPYEPTKKNYDGLTKKF